MSFFGLVVAAFAASALVLADSQMSVFIQGLRLTKAAVLLTVSAILFWRRLRDPVAAMLSLSFLLWTISSSVDFAGPGGAIWPVLLDRCRFVLFALALLLFPDATALARWTRAVATAIVMVFVIGIGEATGLFPTQVYLPLAIACVLLCVGALVVRYRTQSSAIEKRQLKWVALGLSFGIALILAARAGAALTAQITMPKAGSLFLEGLFQLGIVVVALGFLTSLLRYRLYDAEAAISRSAVYAALTLTLVATFAACEALIELVGERYFGSGIGNVPGAVAAAVAAVMLSPVHDRMSDWASRQFERDLNLLKQELPDLLQLLSGSASVREIAAAALPRIEQAVHAARIVLWIDGNIVAHRGRAGSTLAGVWTDMSSASPSNDPLRRIADADYPLGMALRCPYGQLRGWLLLGPRPDGSFYGKADLAALADIAPAMRQAIFQALAREKMELATTTRSRILSDRIANLELKVAMRQ